MTDKLVAWKNKKNRKPLLITGVRQCGKTYILKEFGNLYYDDVAYFNFDSNSRLNSVFENDFDTNRIISELETLFFKRKINKNSALIIFDEIQACPRAISSLKYFNEDNNDYHIISAGSLLDVALKSDGISFPVGKVDRLEMYPMSFEEFVCAVESEEVVDGFKKLSLESKISDAYKFIFEKHIKNYYIVGGMPEVVQSFIDNKNYDEVKEIQDRILKDYRDDFGKHINGATTNKISLVWDSVPSQIAKENNKFIFSHVKSGARAKDLEDALQWLVNAGLVYKLNMVSTPEIPLSGMCDYTYFKVFMSDVGLLRHKLNIDYNFILDNSKTNETFTRFKGTLAENYVMNELTCLDIPLYFGDQMPMLKLTS